MTAGARWARRSRSRPPRRCARAGCAAPASTTLRFLPTRRAARLVPLDDHAAPAHGDLCDTHAAALVLPRGWHLDDERDAHADHVDVVDDDVAAHDPPTHRDPRLERMLDARTPLLRRAFDNTRTA